MTDHRYHNLGWFGKHLILYELGVKLLAPLRQRAAKAVSIKKHMKILDIACGTGAQSYELAKLGHEVTGIDLDKAMLEYAARKMKPGLRLSFMEGDAIDLKFEDFSFNAVTIAFSMHDMPYDIGVRILKEAKRVLTPQGEITIIDYNEPKKSFLARILYHIAMLYESPNYAQFVKNGVERYFTDAHLKVTRRSTILGLVQIVSCK